ncbi:MAG: hypothetical protein ACREQQ_04570, partial [Candidatus Binatia bacterium]
ELNLALGTLVPESTALGSVTDGASLGSAVAGAGTRTNIVAYSENGEVWGMSTTAAAWSDTRACFLSHGGQSSLAYTVAIGSKVQKIR